MVNTLFMSVCIDKNLLCREVWISTRAEVPGGAAATVPAYRDSGRQSNTTRARVRSSVKLECSAGPVCFDNHGVSDGPASAIRPVGEVAARSEPSLLRLIDNDKSGQLSRARDRLSSFCKKLRRTISECSNKYDVLYTVNSCQQTVHIFRIYHIFYFSVLHQCSNAAFVFCCITQAKWKLLKRPSQLRKRRLHPLIVSARCGARLSSAVYGFFLFTDIITSLPL